jgi:hypothetical protein
LRASGPNSLLDMPALTTITGGTQRDDYVVVEAIGGGRVELPLLTDIITPYGAGQLERGIRVSADGAGSAIDLPQLVEFLDLGERAHSSIEQHNAGICLP